MLILVYLLNLFEILACIAGMLHWEKIKNTYWKWFLVYLIVIAVVEVYGIYFGSLRNNTILYNYFAIPLQFLFFFWLFSKGNNSKNRQLWPIIPSSIYLACWVIEYLFLRQRVTWFDSFSYTMGNVLLVILLINYLLRFINSDEILNYKSNMMFWVAVGIAIFYLGTLPFFALRNTLYYQFRDVFTVYNYVQLILGCLMYLVFALSFVWGKPK